MVKLNGEIDGDTYDRMPQVAWAYGTIHDMQLQALAAALLREALTIADVSGFVLVTSTNASLHTLSGRTDA